MHATGRPSRGVLQCGDIRLDLDAYEVSVAGEPVQLYLRELEILELLLRNPNRVLRREEIIAAVWGSPNAVEERTIDVHIRRLRQHLGGKRGAGEAIVTVRGVGYKLDARRCPAAGRTPHRVDS
ncbi:MAG: winged helix-turn-helix domain-containing protein [Candidatus Binatia bacterium]|nr:winged helix-turn-helix domain-containing protein [Candidatus Binatia bacterium]